MPTLTETVTGLLGLSVTVPGGDITGFTDLAGFAVRDNPRRAHLIVSKVLGKHIPVPPQQVLDAGYRLADAVTTIVGGPLDESALVVGYCETATGLGHAVAERLHVPYLHTTRKQHPHLPVEARFDEEHSHAVGHLIQPEAPISLAGSGPLVLVDDELSTGKTALNTIEVLHREFGRPSYVIATLLDARTPEGRAAFEARVADMGVDVRVAAVASAHVTLPADVLDRAVHARTLLPAPAPAPASAPVGGEDPVQVRVYDSLWPEGVPVTARHGVSPAMTHRMREAATHAALAVLPNLGAITAGGSVLVLGTEELMYTPTVLALGLGEHLPNVEVVTQSTTRSPVHAADDPAYAIRRTEEFTCPDDPDRVSRVHNLFDPARMPDQGAWADLRHTDVVVVVDAPASACGPMVEVLSRYATHGVHVVTVPSAPTR